jgi:hypothetical protein
MVICAPMNARSEMPASGSSRQLLRHTLATLAYRGGKALRGAPEGFAEFRVGEKTRTPGQILAHLGDLLEWGLTQAQGKRKWHDSQPLDWDKGAQRFFAALQAFDNYLASDQPLQFPAERLFQGPIADALTHVGQITMLRRLAGSPVRGEDYSSAEMAAGRVGPEQNAPAREFE